MQQVTKVYDLFYDFFIPENKGRFWVRDSMYIRQSLSPLKEALHLLWQTPTLKNGHKTS